MISGFGENGGFFIEVLEVNSEFGKTYDQGNWLCPQDSISKYFNASSYY